MVGRVSKVYIGCAGWSVVSGRPQFAGEGTLLEKYAQVFNAVEINSSFYKPHRRATYAKWAASTPEGFRFSVKAPKAVTHTAGLRGCHDLLAAFVDEVGGLGDKLGAALVQLPPSLAFDTDLAGEFFADLRGLTAAPVVCEPRHATWFEAEANSLLREYQVGRVAADPARVPAAAVPGGFASTIYYRWHGSPRMYYSSYGEEALQALAQSLSDSMNGAERWVIFDNTASGAGVDNALQLRELLS